MTADRLLITLTDEEWDLIVWLPWLPPEEQEWVLAGVLTGHFSLGFLPGPHEQEKAQ